MSKYKQYRNKLNHLLRISGKKYYATYVENNKQNLSKLWKVINSVIDKNEKTDQ